MSKRPPFAVGSYCSSRSWGGLEMNVLRFLKWMRQRGWETFLYARPDSVMFNQAPAFGIPVRSIVVESKLASLWQGRRLAGLTATDGVRFMTLHQSRDLMMAVMTAIHRRDDFGIIYSQHMHIPGNKKDFLHAWQYRRLDAFVTPVNWLAERVKEKTVLTDDDIYIVPRGIETDRFANKPPKSEARAALNLPQHVTLLGVVGRLDPKKGQHVVLKALRRVHDAGRQPHLLIVGAQTLHEETGYESYLHRLVRELDLSDYIHFRPHQAQPEIAYAALDIFILASESETYGMVTIEALCSGLPVIGTDDGGTVDLIDHERNGLKFPPDDDVALAEAIIRCLDNPGFAESMARTAQKIGLTRYSHAAQTDAWESLLIDLATRRAKKID